MQVCTSCKRLLKADARQCPEDGAAAAVVETLPKALADFASTWNTTSTLTGVTAPVESQMVGSADGSTWTLTLPGRDPIPLQASIVGDSLVAVSAEYESILRPGVRVTTRTAGVRSGADLVGVLTATYKTAAGDEVVTGTFRSVRAPQ